MVDSYAVVGVEVYWGIYRGFSAVHWGKNLSTPILGLITETWAVVGLRYRRRLDTFQGLENNAVATNIRVGVDGDRHINFMFERIRNHPP